MRGFGTGIRSLASIDPWLLDMAVELVSPGDVVWDIGANVGLFSFAAAGLAGPSGRGHCYRVRPWLVSLLRLSARTNHGGLAPVDILPVAASAAIDIRHFCIRSEEIRRTTWTAVFLHLIIMTAEAAVRRLTIWTGVLLHLMPVASGKSNTCLPSHWTG